MVVAAALCWTHKTNTAPDSRESSAARLSHGVLECYLIVEYLIWLLFDKKNMHLILIYTFLFEMIKFNFAPKTRFVDNTNYYWPQSDTIIEAHNKRKFFDNNVLCIWWVSPNKNPTKRNVVRHKSNQTITLSKRTSITRAKDKTLSERDQDYDDDDPADSHINKTCGINANPMLYICDCTRRASSPIDSTILHRNRRLFV